jgi:peptidoglycan-associated lipoprotein
MARHLPCALRMMRRISTAITIAACVAMGGACGSKPKATTTPDTEVREHGAGGGDRADEPIDTTAQVETPRAERAGTPRFDPIYFDFDVTELRPEARDTLERIAAWMNANPGATLTITGHADERGTPEYNQALGDERAKGARRYLTRLGVEARRIQTVSYGEERPAVTGWDESSYEKNRRDEFELSPGPSASR